MADEKNFLEKITKGGRLLVEIFFAGAGLIFWLSATVLNPLTDVRKDIVEIKKDVASIADRLEKNISKLEYSDTCQKEAINKLDKDIAIIQEKIK
jgi:site-specific DNA-adenine methylase